MSLHYAPHAFGTDIPLDPLEAEALVAQAEEFMDAYEDDAPPSSVTDSQPSHFPSTFKDTTSLPPRCLCDGCRNPASVAEEC